MHRHIGWKEGWLHLEWDEQIDIICFDRGHCRGEPGGCWEFSLSGQRHSEQHKHQATHLECHMEWQGLHVGTTTSSSRDCDLSLCKCAFFVVVALSFFFSVSIFSISLWTSLSLSLSSSISKPKVWAILQMFCFSFFTSVLHGCPPPGRQSSCQGQSPSAHTRPASKTDKAKLQVGF